MSSRNTSSNNNSGWLIAAALTSSSCLLLLTTAVVSYHYGHRRVRRQRQQDGDDEGVEELMQRDLRLQWYMQRRAEDRLSFHEVDGGGRQQQQQQQQQQSSDEDEDDASIDTFAGELSVNGEHDGTRTHRNNWNHFEGFEDEEDNPNNHNNDHHSHSRSHNRKLEWESARLKSFSRNTSFGSDPDDHLDKTLEGEDLIDDDNEEDGDQTSSDGSFSVDRGSPSSLRRGSNGFQAALPTIFSERNLSTILARPHPPNNRSVSEPRIPSLHHAESLDDRKLAHSCEDSPRIRKLLFTRRNHSSSDLQQQQQQQHSPRSPDAAEAAAINDKDMSLSTHVRHQNRAARAHYNARIMPDNLFLVRHGQSMGNNDEQLYASTPDNAMPLTPLGWQQARQAGRQLRRKLRDCPTCDIHFIVSPYVRTVETFHGIVSAWCDPAEFAYISCREQRLKAWYGKLRSLGLTWHEDPRIREQDFGNYQEPDKILQAKRDRHRFGAFYYRFPHGESASDVYDRVSTFLDSLWRSFDTNNSRNYVLVTHGIAIRVILTRYFRYSINQFHLLANPRNCEMVLLGHNGAGRLELVGRYELVLTEGDDDEHKKDKVVGYKFHKRLRVLPPKVVRKVKIRLCAGDE